MFWVSIATFIVGLVMFIAYYFIITPIKLVISCLNVKIMLLLVLIALIFAIVKRFELIKKEVWYYSNKIKQELIGSIRREPK